MVIGTLIDIKGKGKRAMQDFILQNDELMDFDFCEAKNTNEHFHQNMELLYVLEGDLTLQVENDSFHMKRDDFVIINVNRRHSYSSSIEVLTGFIHMNFRKISRYINTNKITFFCNTVIDNNNANEKVRKVLYKIFNQYLDKNGNGLVYLNSLYYELLNLIISNFVVEKNDIRFENTGNEEKNRINGIVDYIYANYQNEICLSELSKQLYLSETYLSKYFKKKLGMNFKDYLNSIRLSHAVDELKFSNKSMIRVALDNGFPNTAAFDKVFKEAYQMTPSAYAEKMRKNAMTDLKLTDTKAEISEKVRKHLHHLEMKVIENQSYNYVILDALNKRPYPKSWKRMINIGLGSDLLRSDMQEHILLLKKELKFEYVRFWDLYSPELLLNINSQDNKYNFTKLDRIFDFFTENEIKPYIELGFKPIRLIRNTENYFVSQEREILFRNLSEYKKFLYTLVTHYVNRYGMEEVERWYFEQWNDPRYFVSEDYLEYFEVFETAYDTLKSISPQIKLGGGGFQQSDTNVTLQQVIALWKKRMCYPDFISLYSYPYTRGEVNMEYDARRSKDPDFVRNQVLMARDILHESGLYNPELHISEWNSTISNRNCLNDSCYKGAYIMKNIIDVIGQVDLMGYWVGSDLFSEYLDSHCLLNGSGGLLSKDGIRKPGFYAFEFMNQMGNFLLGGNENCVVTTNGHGNYSVACHNYKHPNFKYYMKMEDVMDIAQMQELFDNNELLRLNFQIKHVKNGTYQLKTRSLGPQNGSVQDEWIKMDLSENLNKQELDYLRQICTPHITIRTCEVTDGILNFETVLQPLEIQYIHLLYQL